MARVIELVRFVPEVDIRVRNFAVPCLHQAPGPILIYRDRYPAQVGVRHQPHLPARELQNGAILVGEHDRADTAAAG